MPVYAVSFQNLSTYMYVLETHDATIFLCIYCTLVASKSMMLLSIYFTHRYTCKINIFTMPLPKKKKKKKWYSISNRNFMFVKRFSI